MFNKNNVPHIFLRSQPRINSSTVNIGKLKEMPKNTLGYAYFKFLDHNVKDDIQLNELNK